MLAVRRGRRWVAALAIGLWLVLAPGAEAASEDLAQAAVLQSDGKLVLAGIAANYPGDEQFIWVMRLNPDGTVDMTFSSDGVALMRFDMLEHHADISGNVGGIAIEPGGAIVVGGSVVTSSTTGNDLFAARFTRDGSLDASFGTNGLAWVGTAGWDGALVRQPDGKLVLTGTNGNSLVIARMNSDGSLDPTFSQDGVQEVHVSDNDAYGDRAGSVALYPDGRILFTAGASSPHQAAIVRLLPSGELDTTLGGDGTTLLIDPDPAAFPYTALPLATGGFYIAGSQSAQDGGSQAFAARVGANGNLDETFGDDGLFDTDDGSDHGEAKALLPRPGGGVLIGGSGRLDVNHAPGEFIIRSVTQAGTLDPAFGGGDGVVRTTMNPGTVAGNALIGDPAGTFYLVGQTGSYELEDVGVAAYNADGSAHAGFGTGGVATFDLDITNRPLSEPVAPSVALETLLKTERGKFKTRRRHVLVRFRFGGIGETSFVCATDDAKPRPCRSPHSARLSLGRHTFAVAAVDAAGNTDSTPAKIVVRVVRRR
jgi:uncharacterized delta-60 repeat protein